MVSKYKIALTSLMGNMIEYFGFAIFAIFATEIGRSFFPKLDSSTQTMFVLLIFGVGFLSRPLGALFFGHFGDRIGRKKSLSYTILGMSCVTFLIAILPDYQSWGIASTFVLIALRLLQGFFVGGEGPGAALYMLEHSKKENMGLVGGVIISSIVLGSFLATLIGIVINFCGITNSFSWRIPFFIASFAGLIGLYLRFSLPETEAFLNVKKEKKILKIPIITVFKDFWKETILIAFLGGITTSISYVIMAYLRQYFENHLGMDHITSMQYSSYGIFAFIVFLIILGKVSDSFQPRMFIITFSYILIFTIIPAFLLLNYGNDFYLFLGSTLISFMGAGLCAPAYPYALKKFSAEVRYSGIGISYTLGIAIFGGFSPVISAYSMKLLKLSYSPAFYLIALAIIYLIFEQFLYKKPTND
ncbi:MAG: MHS family proline/betaine transporter-like MFS transporter [Candidatus Midichloriaceae bacterium]|jgi:MHS family proline/betaine transporter-like MFS transporter